MSIEMRSADSAPNPAVNTNAPARGQGQAGAKDGAQQSPFLALLAALEPQAGVAAEAGDAVIVDTDAADATVAQTAMDAASLLAQSMGAAARSNAAAAADALARSGGQTAEGRGALLAKGRPGGAAGGVADAKLKDGLKDALPGHDAAAARDLVASDAAAALVADQRKARPQAALALTRAADARASSEAQAQDVRQPLDGGGMDWKTALSTQSSISATPASAAFAEGLGLQKNATATRSSERQASRSVAAAPGAMPAVGGAEYAVSSNGAAAAPTPVFTLESAGANVSTTLADKLSYWVSRGVQNAELQLDAFGGGSVDVSIALNGREAQVEFRSDVPEARRMLQDAMPQLKEMLQSEGLVLSGGFVGTSAQGDSGTHPQERKSPMPGARSGAIRMDSAELERLPGLGAGAGRATGRTVDLFV